MRPILPLALLAALAFVVPSVSLGAAGLDCWTTTEPTTTLSALGRTYYVLHDDETDEVRIFQEVNTVGGLQLEEDVKDCRGVVEADEQVL